MKLNLKNLPPLPTVEGVEIRHIHGWVGYAVGDDGSVWSCRGIFGRSPTPWKRMTPTPVKSGHLKVQLSLVDGGKRAPKKYVHTLVLIAFVGPRPLGMEARHFPDPNPANNNLANLSWATHARNMLDSKEQGRARGNSMPGTQNFNAKLSDDEVREIHRLCRTCPKLHHVAARFGVSDGLVSMIARGLLWKHLGLEPLPGFSANCIHVGTENKATKLTPDQVTEIRRAVAAKEKSQVQLAAEYGVTQGLVSAIAHNRIWRHL